MRVFLDTNVLLSAFGARGLCSDILSEVLVRHTLLWSDEVAVELKRNLSRKFRLSTGDVAAVLALLEEAAIRVPSRPSPPIRGLDPGDTLVFAAAVNGKADILVTGDRAILKVAGPPPMEVASPRAFWERVRGEGSGPRKRG